MMLPIGFRFLPTDDQLCVYLKSKVWGKELPWGGIGEKNLYGDASPWELFNNDDGWEIFDDDDDLSSSSSSKKKRKQVLYCFTTLRRASRNGSKNYFRLCGCGNWHGETREHRSCDDGLIMKMFKFKIKKRDGLVLDEDADKYSWLMHEYSLSRKSLEEMNLEATDIVLCKITRQEEKRGSRNQHYAHAGRVPELVADNGCDLEVPGGCLGKRKYSDNDYHVIMEQQQQHPSKVGRSDEAPDSMKLPIDNGLTKLPAINNGSQDFMKLPIYNELQYLMKLPINEPQELPDNESQDLMKLPIDNELQELPIYNELQELPIDNELQELPIDNEPQVLMKLPINNELKDFMKLPIELINDAKEENTCEQVQEDSKVSVENQPANQEQSRECMLDGSIDWEALETFNNADDMFTMDDIWALVDDNAFQDIPLGGVKEGPCSLPMIATSFTSTGLLRT